MSKQRHIRWWPAVLIVVLDILVSAVINAGMSDNVQAQRIALILVQLLSNIFLAIWFFFASRVQRRLRLVALFAGTGLICVLAATVRIREVTGDVVPVFEWRWSGSQLDPLEREAEPPSPTAEHVTGAGYPQFLGPSRNGMLPNIHIQPDWNTHPPALIWRQPIGAGWGGFAISDGVAFTQEQRGAFEMVTCYDLNTGELRWSHRDETRYDTTLGGEGPRATPTVSDGRLLTMGATGLVNCLETATGSLIWQRSIPNDFDTQTNTWGNSCSPLVIDQRVYISVGGPGQAVCALDLETGDTVWCSGDDHASYASPTLITLDGIDQVLQVQQASFAGYHPLTGNQLWVHPWPAGQPNVAQPLTVDDSHILVSSGYGIGSGLFEIDSTATGFTASEVWRSPRMKAKFTNLIAVDGAIYGLDDGTLACIDAKTGRRNWRGTRYGHGQVLLLGRHLLVTSERGRCVLVEVDSTTFKEVCGFQALQGKTWNYPAVASDLVLLRNGREAACYRVTLADRG